MSTPPEIDGVIGEQEWAGVPSVRGFVDEDTGAAAEPGTCWLAYDQNFIYFAIRVETDPKKVRATEYRSNVELESDDSAWFSIDPTGVGTQFNSFGVNARGATTIEIAGGRAAKREWLGEFLAHGRLTETGYEVEARVPWGIMRLPAPGVRNPKIMFARVNATTQRETHWVRAIDNKDIPIWQGVDVPASGNRRSLKLLPYVYGGWDRDGHIANAGLDLKTSLSDQIDLVGTVNPDFRNIENQILSLDFSYFERLAEESRPFFLEGGQFFRTSGDAPLFASQRIRQFDAGIKTFGQLTDRTNFAILDTVDFGERNNFVGNVRHRIGQNSSVAAGVTSVTDNAGPDNIATYLSADYSKNGLGVFGQHMTTRDTALGGGHRFNTGFFYNGNGIDSALEYTEITDRFLPRLGFAPERDFRGISTFHNIVRPVPRGSLMEWGISAGGRDYRRFDGSPYRQGGEAFGSLTFRHGLDLDFGAQIEKFEGRYDQGYFFSLEHPRGDAYRRWQVDYFTGHLGGHAYDSFSLTVAYRPIQMLQLSLQAQEVRHFERETQIILGANYDLGRDQSVSGRMVREGHDLNAYLAYRRSGNRGAEYFVILGDPNAQKFRAALVFKAIFPFELRL